MPTIWGRGMSLGFCDALSSSDQLSLPEQSQVCRLLPPCSTPGWRTGGRRFL